MSTNSANSKIVDSRPQLEQRQIRYEAVIDRGTRAPGGRENSHAPQSCVVREDGHARSYIVKRSGTEYRRNRRDLLQTAEVVSRDDDPIDYSIVDAPPAQQVGVVPVVPQLSTLTTYVSKPFFILINTNSV